MKINLPLEKNRKFLRVTEHQPCKDNLNGNMRKSKLQNYYVDGLTKTCDTDLICVLGH